VDRFADATGDHQWIHVDPARAAAGPFGRTIAHGYLTLTVMPALLDDLLHVDRVSQAINYGLDKVRLPARRPVGSHVRLTATVDQVEPVPAVSRSPSRPRSSAMLHQSPSA
jgi:acyl dehydratase